MYRSFIELTSFRPSCQELAYRLSHKTNTTATPIPTARSPITNPSRPNLQRGEHQLVVKPVDLFALEWNYTSINTIYINILFYLLSI